jgi:hypothetical protein
LCRGCLAVGGRGAESFCLESLTALPCNCRRTSPTCPAKFFSTCSLQTNRQGQSLFGHLSSRASCFRRSRTNRFSLTNSASSSVAVRCLPLIMSTSSIHTNLSKFTCHLNPNQIQLGNLDLLLGSNQNVLQGTTSGMAAAKPGAVGGPNSRWLPFERNRTVSGPTYEG